ncbi:M20/M25/M40 family metallo-hydrolase [Micrococcus sp. HSID17245]|uniref:M20/M25/M40 family metallo-hydrolase n=1 Tax=Micrococcus sp. HSID17245 TaxID=2419508 RepID=UPI001EE8E336|nr:M20/M25/M40 family metallo-hydrolase [Micrococcus sp. HSID17245]
MRRTPTLLAAATLAATLTAAPVSLAAPAAPAAPAKAPAATTQTADRGLGPGLNRAGGNPNSPEKLVRSISSNHLRQDIAAFAAIADEHGNRAAGTPGFQASLDYAVGELEEAGYDVELQEFEITYTETLRDRLAQTGPVQRDLEHTVFTSSPSAQVTDAPLTAPSGAATGCADADWAGADLTGSVALVSRGDCTFAQKSQVAAASGAEAVIIYNNAEGALNGTLGAEPGDVVGTVGVTRELGADLLAQTRGGGATVTLDLEQLVEQRPTWNVLAETRTGSDDDVVMLGAHLDGVPEGPGIHDNASGVAATLEVARQAAKANKAESKVRFALWGAEEIGLLGSHHYVDTLTAAEREDIILYTNLDMVAPLDHQNTLGVLTADWSIGAESLLGAQLDRDGHAHQPEGSNGRSDYAPFVDAGIASTGLLSIRDDNYHTPQDDIDNVSITTLTHTARAVANLIGTLQQDADALGTR